MGRIKASKKTRVKKSALKRRRLLYGAVAASFLALILVYIIYSSLLPPQTIADDALPRKAAIVDQLFATFPNASFVETATTILEDADFNVAYYEPEKINVSFYENLPMHGFGLIILRVHATGNASLFTTEPYNATKYWERQVDGQLVAVAYTENSPDLYFGIRSAFVKQSMNGAFSNTVIIMMGCDGLKPGTTMAQAFISKHAKAYISWNGTVSATHTDHTTIELLRYLVEGKFSIRAAIEETLETAGPDPQSRSIMFYYPVSAGNFVISLVAMEITTDMTQMIAIVQMRKRNQSRL